MYFVYITHYICIYIFFFFYYENVREWNSFDSNVNMLPSGKNYYKQTRRLCYIVFYDVWKIRIAKHWKLVRCQYYWEKQTQYV